MNQLFLLKLISDLIKTDKPTVEEIRCARTIVDNLTKEYGNSLTEEEINNIKEKKGIPTYLDDEAEQARKELL